MMEQEGYKDVLAGPAGATWVLLWLGEEAAHSQQPAAALHHASLQFALEYARSVSALGPQQMVRLGTCDPSSGLAWRWDSSSGGALPLVDGLAASLAAAAGGLSGDGGAGDVEPTEGDAAEVVAGEEEEDELEEGEEREPGECSPGAGPASRMQAADPWRTIVCTAAQAWAESLRQGAAAPEAAGAASRLRVVVLTLAGAAQQQRPPASWLVRVLAEAMLRAQPRQPAFGFPFPRCELLVLQPLLEHGSPDLAGQRSAGPPPEVAGRWAGCAWAGCVVTQLLAYQLPGLAHDMVAAHFRPLAALCITGIPMKRSGSSGSGAVSGGGSGSSAAADAALYDVRLLVCPRRQQAKPLPKKQQKKLKRLGAGQQQHQPALGSMEHAELMHGAETVMAWAKVPKDLPLPELLSDQAGSSPSWHCLLLNQGSPPAQSLLKHLRAGKAAGLVPHHALATALPGASIGNGRELLVAQQATAGLAPSSSGQQPEDGLPAAPPALQPQPKQWSTHVLLLQGEHLLLVALPAKCRTVAASGVEGGLAQGGAPAGLATQQPTQPALAAATAAGAIATVGAASSGQAAVQPRTQQRLPLLRLLGMSEPPQIADMPAESMAGVLHAPHASKQVKQLAKPLAEALGAKHLGTAKLAAARELLVTLTGHVEAGGGALFPGEHNAQALQERCRTLFAELARIGHRQLFRSRNHTDLANEVIAAAQKLAPAQGAQHALHPQLLQDLAAGSSAAAAAANGAVAGGAVAQQEAASSGAGTARGAAAQGGAGALDEQPAQQQAAKRRRVLRPGTTRAAQEKQAAAEPAASGQPAHAAGSTLAHAPVALAAVPQLPLSLEPALQLLVLGAVPTERPEFQGRRYPCPLGFKSVRTSGSYMQPGAIARYVCEVVDGGDAGPQFQVVAEDDPGSLHTGSTPTIVWLSIIRRAHEARHQLEVAQATARGQPAPPRRLLPAANGEQLFGLAHAEVQRLLGWGTQAGEQPPTA